MQIPSDSDLPPKQFWSSLICRIELHRQQFSGLQTTIEDEDVWAYFQRLADLEAFAHDRLSEEIARQERE